MNERVNKQAKMTMQKIPFSSGYMGDKPVGDIQYLTHYKP